MNQPNARKLIQKTKDDYNRIAPQFDSTRKYNWRDITTVIDGLGIKKGAKVLDLGCGGGRLYEILEKHGVEYLGIDISEELVKTAKEKYPEADFVVGDIVDFEKKSEFDYVFSIAALHHIPSKALRNKSINNIKSALKDGGTAVVSVWYFWNQPKYFKEIVRQFLRITNHKPQITKLPWGDFYIPWKNHKGEILAQRYHHAWTAREFKKHGFEIISKKRNLVGIYKKSPPN